MLAGVGECRKARGLQTPLAYRTCRAVAAPRRRPSGPSSGPTTTRRSPASRCRTVNVQKWCRVVAMDESDTCRAGSSCCICQYSHEGRSTRVATLHTLVNLYLATMPICTAQRAHTWQPLCKPVLPQTCICISMGPTTPPLPLDSSTKPPTCLPGRLAQSPVRHHLQPSPPSIMQRQSCCLLQNVRVLQGGRQGMTAAAAEQRRLCGCCRRRLICNIKRQYLSVLAFCTPTGCPPHQCGSKKGSTSPT